MGKLSLHIVSYTASIQLDLKDIFELTLKRSCRWEKRKEIAPWMVQVRWGKVPEQNLFLKLNRPLKWSSKKNSYTPEGRRCRKIKHTMRKLDHKYKRSQLFLFS